MKWISVQMHFYNRNMYNYKFIKTLFKFLWRKGYFEIKYSMNRKNRVFEKKTIGLRMLIYLSDKLNLDEEIVHG